MWFWRFLGKCQNHEEHFFQILCASQKVWTLKLVYLKKANLLYYHKMFWFNRFIRFILTKNKFHDTTWFFFANIGLSPFLIHVVVRSGLLTSLSSFHSLSFYIIKGKTNTSSKKPKIPTTKPPSCFSSPLNLFLLAKKYCFFLFYPVNYENQKNKFSLRMEEKILVICIWGFLELVFTFHF